MTIGPSTAGSSQEHVWSEHGHLLIGCLLAGLLLCSAIVLYTNQVKGKAAMLTQNSYLGDSPAETIAPSNITVSSAVLEASSIDRSQGSDAFSNTRQDKQSGITASHKSAADRKGRDELASQKLALSKPGLRKQFLTPTARGGSASLNLSKSRSRNIFPKHHKATLIALWRQTLKRHQNDRLSHLTSNPST
jgi:hypothetical protein